MGRKGGGPVASAFEGVQGFLQSIRFQEGVCG